MNIQNESQKWSLATILYFSLALISNNLSAQNFCKTSHNYPNALANVKENVITGNCLTRDYTVRIAVHIIRRSDGTGGMTSDELNEALAILTQNYLPHDIHFFFKGSDFIDSDNFFNGNVFDFNLRTVLFGINSNSDAIDIYIGSRENPSPGGIASGIPGVDLYIGGIFIARGVESYLPITPVISHEMGHCLGLHHTFLGTIDPPGCPEYVN